MNKDTSTMFDYLETVLEEEYGYIPGALQNKDIDYKNMEKNKLKVLIKEEFPKFLSNQENPNESKSEINEVLEKIDSYE